MYLHVMDILEVLLFLWQNAMHYLSDKKLLEFKNENFSTHQKTTDVFSTEIYIN